MGEDQVSTFLALALTGAGTGNLDSAVFNGPPRRDIVLAIASPAGKVLAVKEDIITILVLLEGGKVDLGGLHYLVGGNGCLGLCGISLCCCLGFFFLVAAGDHHCNGRDAGCECKNAFHCLF